MKAGFKPIKMKLNSGGEKATSKLTSRCWPIATSHLLLYSGFIKIKK